MKVNHVAKSIEMLEQEGTEVQFTYFRNLTWENSPEVALLKNAGYFTIDPNTHKKKKKTAARLLYMDRYRRNNGGDDLRPAFIASVGGAAVCKLTTAQGEQFYGIVIFERSRRTGAFPLRTNQIQDEPRQFCYALARAVSLGRAMQNMKAKESKSAFLRNSPLWELLEPPQAARREMRGTRLRR